MKYLLDTNVCVGFLNQRRPLLTQRFLSVPTLDKVICSIVRGELFYGAYKSQRQVSSLQVIENFLAGYPNLDFDIVAARIQGEIRADLERKGTPIGPYDCRSPRLLWPIISLWSRIIQTNLVAFPVWHWTIGNDDS